jgi:hypothetical protein
MEFADPYAPSVDAAKKSGAPSNKGPLAVKKRRREASFVRDTYGEQLFCHQGEAKTIHSSDEGESEREEQLAEPATNDLGSSEASAHASSDVRARFARNQLEYMIADHRTLEDQNLRYKVKIAELEAVNADLSELEKKNLSLGSEVDRLTKAADDLRRSQSTEKGMWEDWKKQYATQKKELEDEMAKIKKKQNEGSSKLRAKTIELKKKNEEVDSYKKKADELTAEMAVLVEERRAASVLDAVEEWKSAPQVGPSAERAEGKGGESVAKKQKLKGASFADGTPAALPAYEALVRHVFRQTKDHIERAKKLHNDEFPAPPIQGDDSTTAPYLGIIQRNVSANTNTEREIRFFPASTGFAFDDRSIGSSMPFWKTIADASIHSKLMTMGTTVTDSTGKIVSINITSGAKVEYSRTDSTNVTHKYEAIAKMIHPPVIGSSSDQQQQTACWESKMVFSHSYIELPQAFLDRLLDDHSLNSRHDTVVPSSPHIATLAELFASFGAHAKEYDRQKSELWVKPTCLKLWLKTALSRGYTHCSINMHGSSEEAYAAMGKDPVGFDMAYNRSGQKGRGKYVSRSDEVAVSFHKPSDMYHAKKSDQDKHTAKFFDKYPVGTAVLVLLLCKKKKKHVPALPHYKELGAHQEDTVADWTGPSTGRAPYEHFRWHVSASQYKDKRALDNATVIFDSILSLDLGLAVAHDRNAGSTKNTAK